MAGPSRRISWVAIIGGVLALVGLLMVAASDFSFATISNTATFDSVRWTYQLSGAGEVVTGIGFLLGFLGLALGRQT